MMLRHNKKFHPARGEKKLLLKNEQIFRAMAILHSPLFASCPPKNQLFGPLAGVEKIFCPPSPKHNFSHFSSSPMYSLLQKINN